jgi:hypothetical protein
MAWYGPQEVPPVEGVITGESNCPTVFQTKSTLKYQSINIAPAILSIMSPVHVKQTPKTT